MERFSLMGLRAKRGAMQQNPKNLEKFPGNPNLTANH